MTSQCFADPDQFMIGSETSSILELDRSSSNMEALYRVKVTRWTAWKRSHEGSPGDEDSAEFVSVVKAVVAANNFRRKRREIVVVVDGNKSSQADGLHRRSQQRTSLLERTESERMREGTGERQLYILSHISWLNDTAAFECRSNYSLALTSSRFAAIDQTRP